MEQRESDSLPVVTFSSEVLVAESFRLDVVVRVVGRA